MSPSSDLRNDLSRDWKGVGMRYWGFFRYKKRLFSIQDIIIYHHISRCYHCVSLCIIVVYTIYHVPRRHMIYPYIIFFSSACNIMCYHADLISRS